jgi:hypothetical protein
MVNRAEKKTAALVVAALIAVVALAGLLLKANAGEGEVVLLPMQMTAEGKDAVFKMSMRKLWVEHVIWTRSYVVATIAGSPDAAEIERRMLRNQEDIAAVFTPFYGPEAGAKLGALLKDHILIAGEVVKAAKKGDDAKFRDADKRWHDNAVEIATFFNGVNPKWSKEEFVLMFNDHLALTTKQTTARLHKNWAEDIAAFDEIYTQMLLMADHLADGIIAQYPEKI